MNRVDRREAVEHAMEQFEAHMAKVDLDLTPEHIAEKIIEVVDRGGLPQSLEKSFSRLAEFAWAGWVVNSHGFAWRQLFLTQVSAEYENGIYSLTFEAFPDNKIGFTQASDALEFVSQVDAYLADAGE